MYPMWYILRIKNLKAKPAQKIHSFFWFFEKDSEINSRFQINLTRSTYE